MDLASAVTAINDRLLANWAQFANADDQITFENEEFDPGTFVEWARSTIIENIRQQQTFGPVGSRKYLVRGSHMFNIYTPNNTDGTNRSNVLVDHFRSIFEGVTFSEIRFHNAPFRGRIHEGEWLQTTVEALFDYHETK